MKFDEQPRPREEIQKLEILQKERERVRVRTVYDGIFGYETLREKFPLLPTLYPALSANMSDNDWNETKLQGPDYHIIVKRIPPAKIRPEQIKYETISVAIHRGAQPNSIVANATIRWNLQIIEYLGAVMDKYFTPGFMRAAELLQRCDVSATDPEIAKVFERYGVTAEDVESLSKQPGSIQTIYEEFKRIRDARARQRAAS